MSRPAPGSTPGVQSLERALTVLEFIRTRKRVGVRELTREVGLHRSSIYRMLSVLQRWGYVREDSDGVYCLGWRFLEMAGEVNYYEEITRVAMPLLEDLMRSTRETTHLMALEGVEVVYLAKVESPETIRMHSRVGARRPAYCTAGGKILLAHLPLDERARRIRACRMERLTDNTLTEPEALMEVLDQVAARGWAGDDEEVEVGVCCVAAPIVTEHGTAVAAVTVSSPTFRTPLERLLEYLPLVQATAARVSDCLRSNPRRA